MMIRLASVAATMLMISGCGNASQTTTAVATSSEVIAVASETPAADTAQENARANLEGTTYADVGAPYGCTEDCSGHEAGYDWALENEISDAIDCDGNSESFREGCEAYVEELEANAEAEEEAN